MKKRVSIVEDYEQTADELCRILDESYDFQCYHCYSSAEEALEGIPLSLPDLVIMDLGLPGMDGDKCIESLREQFPELRIIVLTVFEDDEHILRSIEAGANGYLLKDIDPALLLAELRVMQLGGGPISPPIARKIIRKYKGASLIGDTGKPVLKKEKNIKGSDQESLLSSREVQVLELVSLGFVYGDIAHELDISSHTVRRHVENIYKKLNVHSRSEAIIKGRRIGLVDLSE